MTSSISGLSLPLKEETPIQLSLHCYFSNTGTSAVSSQVACRAFFFSDHLIWLFYLLFKQCCTIQHCCNLNMTCRACNCRHHAAGYPKNPLLSLCFSFPNMLISHVRQNRWDYFNSVLRSVPYKPERNFLLYLDSLFMLNNQAVVCYLLWLMGNNCKRKHTKTFCKGLLESLGAAFNVIVFELYLWQF